MREWESFFHQPKPFNILIKDSIVVVDANVLLSAYQWREVTVKEMLKTLKRLSDQNRLRIPKQVVMEFSKNRPNQIIQRINDIEMLIAKLQVNKSLNQKAPILEEKKVYEEAEKLQEEYNEATKKYKKSLIELRNELKKLFQHDTYLESINEILHKSYYDPEESKDESKLKEEADKRFSEKKPPGYRDSAKEDNSIGDFVIWHNILQLKSNVIFVSGDKKDDWVYKDQDDNPLSARRELIKEFYEVTEGKDFCYISPKEFITLLNPEVSSEVQEDLALKTPKSIDVKPNKAVRKSNEYYKHVISETLTKYDPMKIIYDFQYQSDEYSSEAEDIYKLLPTCNSYHDVYNLVRHVFRLSFSGDEMMITDEEYHSLIDSINYFRREMRKNDFLDFNF